MLKSTTELNKICCQLTCFLLLIIMLPSHDLLLTCLARTYYVSALLSSALIRMIKIKYKLSIMRQLSFIFVAGHFMQINCANSRFRPIWIKLIYKELGEKAVDPKSSVLAVRCAQLGQAHVGSKIYFWRVQIREYCKLG